MTSLILGAMLLCSLMIVLSNLMDMVHGRAHKRKPSLTPEEIAYLEIMREQEEQDEREFYLSLKRDR